MGEGGVSEAFPDSIASCIVMPPIPDEVPGTVCETFALESGSPSPTATEKNDAVETKPSETAHKSKSEERLVAQIQEEVTKRISSANAFANVARAVTSTFTDTGYGLHLGGGKDTKPKAHTDQLATARARSQPFFLLTELPAIQSSLSTLQPERACNFKPKAPTRSLSARSVTSANHSSNGLLRGGTVMPPRSSGRHMVQRSLSPQSSGTSAGSAVHRFLSPQSSCDLLLWSQRAPPSQPLVCSRSVGGLSLISSSAVPCQESCPGQSSQAIGSREFSPRRQASPVWHTSTLPGPFSSRPEVPELSPRFGRITTSTPYLHNNSWPNATNPISPRVQTVPRVQHRCGFTTRASTASPERKPYPVQADHTARATSCNRTTSASPSRRPQSQPPQIVDTCIGTAAASGPDAHSPRQLPLRPGYIRVASLDVAPIRLPVSGPIGPDGTLCPLVHLHKPFITSIPSAPCLAHSSLDCRSYPSARHSFMQPVRVNDAHKVPSTCAVGVLVQGLQFPRSSACGSDR